MHGRRGNPETEQYRHRPGLLQSCREKTYAIAYLRRRATTTYSAATPIIDPSSAAHLAPIAGQSSGPDTGLCSYLLCLHKRSIPCHSISFFLNNSLHATTYGALYLLYTIFQLGASSDQLMFGHMIRSVRGAQVP